MYQPGTLFSPNYSPRVRGVGAKDQSHAVFTSKPCVGPIDQALETSRDAFATTGRRTMGMMSPRQTVQKDVFSLSNDSEGYTLSSTSTLGKNLFDSSMTQRMSTDYSGNPIWSDAGRNQYARVEGGKDVMQKPLVGDYATGLTDARYNEDHNRLPAKFSPSSRSLRPGCPDLGQRHPNGRPFANVILAVPPQRQDEDSPHWHYSKDMNTSHGVKNVSHRSSGGKFFRNSAVTGETIMNTRTESIQDRDFYDMGTKPRTMYGGGYTRAVKEREGKRQSKCLHLVAFVFVVEFHFD